MTIRDSFVTSAAAPRDAAAPALRDAIPRPRRVVLVSAEVAGFARTGGLGDAVDGLARALAHLGADVVVVTPRYGVTTVPPRAVWWPESVPAETGWGEGDARRLGVLEVPVDVPKSAGTRGALRVCLLDEPTLFLHRTGLYGDGFGEFGDNALRFAVLSRGALSVADRVWGPVHGRGAGATRSGDLGDHGPDVLHAHDWHAALALLYARLRMGPLWRALPAVLTIHNLAFQGTYPRSSLAALGLPEDAWRGDLLEHFGNLNLLKGAAAVADRTLTVSEGYAQEILRPEDGCSLDGFLRDLGPRLVGIENGIDTTAFDPATDRHLVARYDATTAPVARATNKRALVAELGLDALGAGGDGPVVAVVSRLAWQKGIDLFLEVVPHLVARGARVVLVGTGEEPLEDAIADAAERHPGRVAARIAFDGALARRIYGSTDFLVVPSRFEPCGLTQLYAMRYGALPIVTPVGGLKDTVTPIDVAARTGTGVVAAGRDPEALRDACDRALALYADRPAREAAVRRAMARDSSWDRSARAHLALYDALVAERAL